MGSQMTDLQPRKGTNKKHNQNNISCPQQTIPQQQEIKGLFIFVSSFPALFFCIVPHTRKNDTQQAGNTTYGIRWIRILEEVIITKCIYEAGDGTFTRLRIRRKKDKSREFAQLFIGGCREF